jgi:predicted PurR-regulated permease PerM
VVVGLAAALYAIQVLWRLLGVIFDILLVLFLAWILSSSIKRILARIRRWLPHQHQWAAMPLAFLAILLPIVLLFSVWVPYGLSQAVGLSDDLPEYTALLRERLELIEDLGRRLGINVRLPGTEESLIAQVGAAIGQWVQRNAAAIIQSTTQILFSTFLVIVLAVYMVLEGDRLSRIFYQIVPQPHHEAVRGVLQELDFTFFSYLRGILIVAVIYSVWITIVMVAAGLPFALLLGTVSGFIQIIPVLGEIGALGIPLTVSFLTKSLTTTILVGAALLGFSLTMNNFVLPRILGNATRMPGLLVLLAIVIGSQVLGPWGAILGVPIAAFLYSLVTAWAGIRPLGAREEIEIPQDGDARADTDAQEPARERS